MGEATRNAQASGEGGTSRLLEPVSECRNEKRAFEFEDLTTY